MMPANATSAVIGGAYVGDWTPPLARLFPDNEAIFEVRTNTRVTYRDLEARVDRTARGLLALGVEPGDRVAVLAKNRIEQLELLFACGRLGALFVPFNWRLAEPELAFLLDDTEAKLLFFDAEFAFVAGHLCPGEGRRKTQAVAFDKSADEELSVQTAVWPLVCDAAKNDAIPSQAPVGLDDPWIVLYTSGTTGRPKGALLPYRQVAFNALNTIVALDLVEKDRTLTYTPLFHTGALHVLTTPLFAKGGSIVLTDGFDAEQALSFVTEERCTLLFGVPTTFEMMAASDAFASTDFSNVRLALCGGAPCPISLIETYTGRGVVFKQGYGLTEVGPNCLNLRGEDAVRKAGSAGQPNLTIQAQIRDADGNVVEGRGRGELCLGGPCVCLGYWRRPEANESTFTEDGYFKTGDIVERDEEGFFTIVDRAKDMFISGGENVYPAEVEKALSDHPDVRGCAVIGVPDEKWGEVGQAFVELKTDKPLAADEMRAWLKTRLASYKVPKHVVALDALPRNPSGKVQKHLLPRDGAGARGAAA